MNAATPIIFSEHVLEYAQSRGVALAEIAASIRTEEWHRHGRDRYESRKNFAHCAHWGGAWYDTKQVRVVFAADRGRVVVITAYGYLVRTRPADAAA